jgi:poly-gamma-glutamate capsule biosynthesis protein CapA/YwtB (metallophosphatase superfamily)
MKNSATPSIRLFVVGDLGIHRENPDSIFASVRPFLEQATILIGNSEYPLTDRGQPWPGKREPIRRTDPRIAQVLHGAGFTAVSLSNNHAMDYGVEGIHQTMEVLDASGVAHAGAGRTDKEAHTPIIIEKEGVRIALLSYTSVFFPGYSATETRSGIATVRVETQYRPTPWSLDTPGVPLAAITIPDPGNVLTMTQDVKLARATADVVIVSWHWGIPITAGHRGVLSYQQELGHAAIDAGADLVFGHHPHVLQGIEKYHGRVIFHSLSHFAMDAPRVHVEPDSLLVDCVIQDGHLGQVGFHPVLFNSGLDPQIATGDQRMEIFTKLQQLSAPFGTRLLCSDDLALVD